MQPADSLNTGAPTPRTSEGEAPAMSIVPALRRYAVSCEGGEPEPAPELAHAAADEIERLSRENEQLLAIMRGIRLVADGALEKASR
jgi:hypothetical protein